MMRSKAWAGRAQGALVLALYVSALLGLVGGCGGETPALRYQSLDARSETRADVSPGEASPGDTGASRPDTRPLDVPGIDLVGFDLGRNADGPGGDAEAMADGDVGNEDPRSDEAVGDPGSNPDGDDLDAGDQHDDQDSEGMGEPSWDDGVEAHDEATAPEALDGEAGCVPSCVDPDGTLRVCGDDGCGGSCGICPPWHPICNDGRCGMR